MAHRVYRLAISPDDFPEVRRVIDFDGRCSLSEVHRQLVERYRLDASEHLYAFFTSGRAWDEGSAYFDPRTTGRSAERGLLFRLNLAPGKSLAYVLDFGAEQRFTIEVVSVTDAASPLSGPVLVEAAGELPEPSAAARGREHDDGADDQDPPELAPLVSLAEAFLDSDDELEELEGEPEDAPDRSAPIMRASADAALALLGELGGDSALFFKLDDWLMQRALSVRLLDLPLRLAHAGEHERAIALARGLSFVDRELMLGDLAIVLAKAGRSEEALAQVAANLEQAEDATLVEAKAGEVYRALGDLPAAEAYFRRSLLEAKTSSERMQALLRLASCLMDQGREAEANLVLKDSRKLDAEVAERQVGQLVQSGVGRNDPCPCGSGRKYKKCHGAS
jgi:uncharacterized protein YchJ